MEYIELVGDMDDLPEAFEFAASRQVVACGEAIPAGAEQGDGFVAALFAGVALFGSRKV